MKIESHVSLQPYNTFGIAAKALQLVRVQSEADIQALLADPQLRDTQKFVLGGGSNIVLTGDLKALVLKVELKGMRLVEETEKAWIIEAAAGEERHHLEELRAGAPHRDEPGVARRREERFFGPDDGGVDAVHRFDDVAAGDFDVETECEHVED